MIKTEPEKVDLSEWEDISYTGASPDKPVPADSEWEDVSTIQVEQKKSEASKKEAIKKDPNMLERIDAAMRSNPVVQGLAEMQGGANAYAVDLIDFFTTDQINSILEISGSEKRVPTLGGAVGDRPEVAGGFMEDGKAKDIMRGIGQAAPAALGGMGMLRQAARQLPAATAAESASIGALREIGKTTAGSELVASSAAVAGGEMGEKYGGEKGGLIGTVLAPLSVGAVGGTVKNIAKASKDEVVSLFNSLSKMSDEGASELLANYMVRSGLKPDDVGKKLSELGNEGVLADVSEGFSRLLKDAANKIPRIEGRARIDLDARQAARGDRALLAFDDASGTAKLSASDELKRIEEVTKPQITELYGKARSGQIELSENLSKFLNNTETSLGKARVAAEQRIVDKRALGEDVGTFTVIDETKRELDDRIGAAIRKGKMARAYDLMKWKTKLVAEADEAIPEYKQARDLYAGTKELENTVDVGRDFLKMKPRLIEEYSKGLSESEKRMFKLGAKDAIIDKLDSTQLTSNVMKQMFGKGGSNRALRSLFDTEQDFMRFNKALEREANFVRTRQAIQGGSSTFKQAYDGLNPMDAVEAASGSPVQWARVTGRILNGVSKNKDSEANIKSLEQAGDILLQANMEPDKVIAILKRGNRSEIKNRFDQAYKQLRKQAQAAQSRGTSAVGAASAQATGDDNGQ